MKSSNTRVASRRRLPSLGRSDGRRRDALSDSPGRYEAGNGIEEAHQERRGHPGALMAIFGIGDTIASR